MATVDLQVTSVISATGWSAATQANLSSSNDVRATGGNPAELIQVEFDDVPGDFGSLNSVQLFVEGRVVGTVGRAKNFQFDLQDSANTILQTFDTGTLTSSDQPFNSSAFSRADAASVINGYRGLITVEEGGGMADSATCEVDHIFLRLDYNVAAGPATSYQEAEAGGFAINAANALGAKVAAAMLPISSTVWEDVANSITGTLIGSPTIGQDSTGRYIDFDGSDDAVDMGQSYMRGASPIIPNFGVNGQLNASYSLVDVAADVLGTIYGERDGNPAAFQVFMLDGDVSVRRNVTGSLIIPDHGAGLLGVGHSYDGTDLLRGYLNGSLEQTRVDVAGSSAEVNLSIGARWEVYPATDFRLTGKIYLVFLFNTNLSAAEQASLHSNPWQVFEYGDPGSVLLFVDNASHGHAADSVALSQAHQLAANDAAHGHAVDSVALSQGYTLEPADALHDHAADGVVLSLSTVLAVAAAAHVHGADNVALTQAHVLSIAEALHGHAAEGVTLQQAQSLAVAGAVHGHSADSVSLTAAQVLSVASAIHVHQAGEIELTQDHVLVVSNALHQHLAEALALQLPAGAISSRAVFVVESQERIFIVAAGERVLEVSQGERLFIVSRAK